MDLNVLYDIEEASQHNNTYFLKLFSDYAYESALVSFQYDFDAPELSNLRNIYTLEMFSRSKELNHQIQLMKWVRSMLIPDGACIPRPPIDALHILENTKKYQIRSNCWMFATVLNEVYLAFGYRSKMIRCMPMDLRYDDCHCITHVYSTQLNKWIIMDAAYAGYYLNEEGIPIGLPELRQALLDEKKVYIPGVTRESKRHILNYWRKNIVRFETYRTSRYGSESQKGEFDVIHLNPQLYKLVNMCSVSEGRTLNHIHISNPDIFWS